VASANQGKTHCFFDGSKVDGDRIRRGCCWMIAGLAMVWLVGCGGAPEPAPQKTPSRSTARTQPPAPPVTTPSAPATLPVGGGTSTAGDISPGGPPPEPTEREEPKEKVPRPEDVAQWKQADFLSAKRQHDPRLIEAIEHLATQRVGDPSVVPILVAILTGAEPDEEAGQALVPTARGSRSQFTPSRDAAEARLGIGATMTYTNVAPVAPPEARGVPQLDERAITCAIDALVLNDTDQARTVLRKIVSGELPTDDDWKATQLAMKTLLEKPTSEGEALMRQVLLGPEKFREPSRAPTSSRPGTGRSAIGMGGGGNSGSGPLMSAEDLHGYAMRLVDLLASESFRVKLTRYLLSTKATPKQQEQLGPMLQQPRPENVASQLLIYQASVEAPQLKVKLEEYFTQISSVALGHVLGILADKEPEPPSPDTRSSKTRSGWEAVGSKKTGKGGGGISARSPQGLHGSSSGGELSLGEGGPAGLSIGGGLGGRHSMGSSRHKGQLDVEAPEVELDDPKVIYPLAKKLWDSKTVDNVLARVQKIESLEPQSATLGLARTMPLDQVRAGVYQLLRSRFEDGPNPLVGGDESGGGRSGGHRSGGRESVGGGYGLGGGGISLEGSGGRAGGEDGSTNTFWDPGFLVVVKMLPREDKPRRSAGRSRTTRSQPPRGALSMEHEGMEEAETPTTTPAEQWLKASENLLVQLCQQCSKAAEAQPGDLTASGKIPVKPHRGAEIVARYDLKWPDDVATKLGDFKLDPIEVHYVRIEETAQFSRLVKYYRRAVRTRDRTVGQNDAWLDSVRDSATPGCKRSCDVLITRTGGGGAPGGSGATRTRQKEPSEPLVVQILTIEMKDPTGGQPASTSKSAKR